MIKALGVIGTVFIFTLLSGCQTLNGDLAEINGGLSKLTGQGTTASSSDAILSSKKQIKSSWNISNTQAMAWLSHDKSTWNDNGKIKSVNWYTFWSEQIHYKTSLANQAYEYCHKNSWETPKPGANCQTYFQAYSMTNSEESLSWGKKMEESE